MPEHAPVLLVAALVRALGHQIRTPLSVIQNDLSYLATIAPAEECRRGLDRCRRIADILKAAMLSGGTRFEQGECDLLALAREHQYSSTLGEARCRGDREKLAYIVQSLPSIVASLAGTVAAAELSREDRCIALSARATNAAESPRNGDYVSLTELSLDGFKRDLIESVLVDAIVWSHGGSVRTRVANTAIQCHLLIPCS